MNTTKTLRLQDRVSLPLLLVAAALALGATAARSAPRSEMVVPGYKPCAPKVQAAGKKRTARMSSETQAKRLGSSHRQMADASGSHCELNQRS
ncbi:MAG: hypothetical protein KDF54_03935 [Hydrogenophaga sp.]|nr:hypothetical protein [Hydrogenophaga sp.]